MSELSHLLESVRAVAGQDRDARIVHLRQDRWIDYPRAAGVLKQLEELLVTPVRTRMPCLLIHGDSGMGKTMLMEKFRRSHRSHYSREQGVERLPIVSIEMPPRPTERRVYANLLQAVGAPFRPSDRLDALEYAATTVLRRLQPKMIVIDEVHHLLAGSPREQRTTLNQVKFLSNTLHCSIVALGTQDALVALQSDAQIASRFATLALPRWVESEALRRFLAALEKTLPLREKSDLAERDMVMALLGVSDGITGRITEAVLSAAREALLRNQERITPTLLAHRDGAR